MGTGTGTAQNDSLLPSLPSHPPLRRRLAVLFTQLLLHRLGRHISLALFCSLRCFSLAATSFHPVWLYCAFLPSPRTFKPPSSSFEFLRLLSLEGILHDAPEVVMLHSFRASILPPPLPFGFLSELTAALLAKDKRNAFGLMKLFWKENADERRVRAYGIYPYGAVWPKPLWAMPGHASSDPI